MQILAIDKSLFVGMQPKYPRWQDVEIQASLVHADIEIVYSLKDLAKQVIYY